ncbi:Halolysin [ANME-1 cluster archaeon GoMg2]|nr:Halolysin [ANME-1 cluster archaeon GoMg2]
MKLNKMVAFLMASIVAISIVAMAMPVLGGEDMAKVGEKPAVVIPEPSSLEPEPKKPEELDETKPEVTEPDSYFNPVFRDAVIIYFKKMPASQEEFASKYGVKLIFVKEDVKMAAFETEPSSMPMETSQRTLDFVEEVSRNSRVEKAYKDGFMFVRPNKAYTPEPMITYPEDFDKKGWEYIPKEAIVGFWRLPPSLEEFASRYGATLKSVDVDLLSALFEIDDVTGFIKRISTDPYVSYIEPNGVGHITYVPDDPKWNQQWGPKKIYCPEAWDYQKGNTRIFVPILDTGVDYNHEDLYGRVIKGYDYVNNDNDPMDDHNHGTHCAGICGAIMDNNKGIAGVAQVSLIAVKVADNTGLFTWENLAKGINYSANWGPSNCAKVISMSLETDPSSRVEQACEYAYYDKGCVLVASSGNYGGEQIEYPAAYDTVIAVGATDSNDQRWYGSNYGNKLELVAPGVNIHSTIRNNGYESWTGTSMAAPHVSGVAALMWSQNPKVAYNNVKVREVLKNTAIDLGTSGKDKYYGYGKVNAYAAATSGVVLTDKSGSFTDNHEDYTFSVSVPAPSAVNVVMAGNETADFDLYAKWGSPPTTTNYDARGYSVTSLEYFTVEGSGTLYIMVRSWWGTGNWKCWVLSGDPSASSGRKRGTLSETGDTATYSLSDTGIGYAFNSGPDGSNFDLYTKWNSPPTTTSYDARGYTSWAQEIAGPATNSGTLHFMVRSRSGSGGYATVGEIF